MYIKQLDLIPIPLELETLTTNDEAFRNTPWLVRRDGVYKPSGHYQRCEVMPELVLWFNKNVTDEYLHVSACQMYGEHHNAPHTDTTRDYTLIYLVDLGGDDVTTVFYQEQGQPLHRPRHCHPHYDTLDILIEYKLKLRTWYLLDSRIIHSVEGINGVRKSIQAGFDASHSWANQYFTGDMT